MKASTSYGYSYIEYMLKLERLVIILSDYNAKLLKHRYQLSQQDVLKLTHEVQNYNVLHHHEIEQQSIKQRTRMCAELNPAHYDHMVVVYVISLNKTIEVLSSDGVTLIKCPLFKFGQACRIWSKRMDEHDREFQDNQHIYIQCVDNGISVEQAIKSRFNELHVMSGYQTRPNCTMHREIFYSTPEYNINRLINEIHQLCLPRRSISMKEKQLSDLSTKFEYVELENKKNCNELMNMRAQLAQKSEECAVAQSEVKIYKDIVEKLLAAKKDEPESESKELEEIENKETKEIPESQASEKKSKAPVSSLGDILKRTCPHCKKVYSTPAGMRRHVRGKHEGKYQKWCDECEKSFYDSGSYSKHVNEVHKQILRRPCPECKNKKTFATKATLDRHLAIVHGGAKKECPECHKVMTAGALGQHIKEKHSDELKVECEECGEILGNKKYLKAHIEQVHLKLKVKCTICGLDVLKYQLNKHMHAEHPDEVVCRKSVTPSEDTKESDA